MTLGLFFPPVAQGRTGVIESNNRKRRIQDARGENLPTVDNLYALSRLFGVTINDILVETRFPRVSTGFQMKVDCRPDLPDQQNDLPLVSIVLFPLISLIPETHFPTLFSM